MHHELKLQVTDLTSQLQQTKLQLAVNKTVV
jgi:hypothetical protein